MPKHGLKPTKSGSAYKFTPETINAFLVAILQAGNIGNALKLLPVKISPQWISAKRRTDAEFDRRVALALKAHKAGNPEQDFEKITLLDDAFLRYLKEGELETLTEHDPDNPQKVLRIQRRIKKRFDPEVWRIIHPKRIWSEQAVLMVTANQLQDLAGTEELTEAERSKFIKWLSGWIVRATDELRRQGLTVKQLAETNE